MRRTATAAILLTTALLFSACSADEDTDATASDDETSASSEAEASPSEGGEDSEESSGDDVAADTIPSLALTATDFPAPYEFIELTPEQLASGVELTGGFLKDAEVTPAECAEAALAAPQPDLTQTATAVASDPGTQTTVSVALTPYVAPEVDLEEFAETCATFTFSLAGPDGAALEGDATVELLPAPDVDADDVRALRQSVTITLGEQEQTAENTIYSAALRGVAVGVFASGPADAGVDTAVLEGLLDTGLEKVRSAP